MRTCLGLYDYVYVKVMSKLHFRYLLVLLQATLGVKTVFQHLEVTQLASHARIEAWGCSPFPNVLLLVSLSLALGKLDE